MGRYDERRLWSNVGSEGEGPASDLRLTAIDIGCKDWKWQDGLAAGRVVRIPRRRSPLPNQRAARAGGFCF
jgi:hypothetical protein